MMRYYIVLCMAFVMMIPLSAQRQKRDYPYYPNYVSYGNGKWKENVFVSAGGGLMSSFSSSSLQAGFFKMQSPHIYAALGKDINPFWSYRGVINAWEVSEIGGVAQELKSVSFVNLNLDLMCNLVNAFGGYKLKRHWVDVYVFAGPYMNIPIEGGFYVGASGGGQIKFNIDSRWSVDVEGRLSRQRSMAYPDYDRFYLTGTVGVSYTFGGKRF